MLKRALRRAPEGLPQVSTFTILYVLHEAGYTWQRDRTWCETGVAFRKCKGGVVVRVEDPDATAKRGSSSRRTRSLRLLTCPSGPRMKEGLTR